MTAKQRLVKELGKFKKEINSAVYIGEYTDLDKIANFILSDRRRIVEPLVKYREILNNPDEPMNGLTFNEAIDETLKLAGVGE